MRCPACDNEDPAGSKFCSACGHDYTPRSDVAPVGGGQPIAPPPPANPGAKRRTVFDPGAPPAAGAPASRGNIFDNPPPPRPAFNPADPFGATVRGPTGPAPQPVPLQQAAPPAAEGGAWAAIPPPPQQPGWPAPAGPAPAGWPAPPQAPQGGWPQPPPAQPHPAPRKAATIIESPQQAQGLVRGALFEYRGPADPGRAFPLRAGRNVIGRSPECEVCIDDGRVSGQHAYLFVRAEDASYMDVSTNGSRVDGKAVVGEQVVVSSGAVFEIGGSRLVLMIVPESILTKAGIKEPGA